MLDFFFLNAEKMHGKYFLDIFSEKPETILAPITDYSLLLGGSCFGRKVYFSEESKHLAVGEWWTSTYGSGYTTRRTINYYGRLDVSICKARYVGARPAISYSKIKKEE